MKQTLCRVLYCLAYSPVVATYRCTFLEHVLLQEGDAMQTRDGGLHNTPYDRERETYIVSFRLLTV